ncbi:MAG: sulfurtransferase [Gammaproteobacteria bacterium]|nr:sulfurtransferase [Gammaproteobacteria bacterium]MDH5778206.1 sulfurtransferase [Gammaproteobacteria bacterium]
MSKSDLPLIIEPNELEAHLADDNILLVDLSQPQTYVQYHIPSAVYLDYAWIIHIEQPRMGLLPDEAQLSNVLSALGLSDKTHVIAYDDEGGGRACRFLWTLDVVGHAKFSLLNGGLSAWANEGHNVTSEIDYPQKGKYIAKIRPEPIADRQYILDHLNNDQVTILDARSPQEYAGTKVFAQRGGHIPGAVNIEWTEAMDKDRNMRLRPENDLREMLETKAITPDKEIITHCQTHHRSAHSYIMLKSLGYTNIKGYPGSWSDWGNDTTTPIEN